MDTKQGPRTGRKEETRTGEKESSHHGIFITTGPGCRLRNSQVLANVLAARPLKNIKNGSTK